MENISRYLKAIGRIPMLTDQETNALVAKLPDQEARNALVSANLRLVVHIAKDYHGKGISQMDLIQLGNLGLMKATVCYDPNRGRKFSTFSVYYIRERMIREFRHQKLQVPVCSLADTAPGALATESKAEADHLTEETIGEIDSKVESLLNRGIIKAQDVVIFRARIYMDKTLSEIAETLQITSERVRQIEARLCKLLKTKDIKTKLKP